MNPVEAMKLLKTIKLVVIQREQLGMKVYGGGVMLRMQLFMRKDSYSKWHNYNPSSKEKYLIVKQR